MACSRLFCESLTKVLPCSPGYIDLQLNGAYSFDFSVYEGDEAYKKGMKLVAERIVETGVTSWVQTQP